MKLPNDVTIADLKNAGFLAWLKKSGHRPSKPKLEDMEKATNSDTEFDRSRAALAKQIISLYREWEAEAAAPIVIQARGPSVEFDIGLSAEEYASLAQRASNQGLRVREYLRKLIRDGK